LKGKKTIKEKFIIKKNNLDIVNKDKFRENKNPFQNIDPNKIWEE
jgi:hypothetical protein